LAAAFAPFIAQRDIIFIDQRGTGQSRPALTCPEVAEVRRWYLGQPAGADADGARLRAALAQCHDRLAAAGIATAAYTSAESAADLAALRQALGLPRWNIVGVSYGARLALLTLNTDPAGIRSLVLDSVYPPQVNLFSSAVPNFQRALDALFAACAADAACATDYPHLETTFWQLYDRLNAQPAIIPLRLAGRPVELWLTGDRLANQVFGWLYDRAEIEAIPYRLARLAESGGTEAATVRAGLRQELAADDIATGLYYAVQCSEDVPRLEPAALARLAHAFPRWRDYLAQQPQLNGRLVAVCQAWRTQPPAPGTGRAVAGTAPVLLLNGAFDPITPPEWATLAAATLPAAFRYTLADAGHGVLRSSPCAQSLMQQFLDDPARPPPSACVSAAPPLTFWRSQRLPAAAPGF
nr:alpha/beta hydrolase [Anaerolineae bacterium]